MRFSSSIERADAMQNLPRRQDEPLLARAKLRNSTCAGLAGSLVIRWKH
jgi:hypothetical protein